MSETPSEELLASTGADVATHQADRLTVRAVDWAYGQAKALIGRRRDASALKRILGIDRDPRVAYRSASVHSLYRDGVHPDNLDPLLALTREEIARGDNPSDPTAELEVMREIAVPMGHSQVRFGSPTSDGGTRVLFGYGGEGEDNRLVRQVEPLDFPFRWELANVGDEVAYRYVRNKGKVGRPLWRIVARKRGTPFIPELDSDGFLETDYLIVTRVRNYLGDAWRTGTFVVSFGGAHGTGTRAVSLLASDHRELAKAHSALRRLGRREPEGQDVPNCFQLLFKVNVEHDPDTGSNPSEVRFEDAEMIDDHEDTWIEAARRTAPGLAEWQNSSIEANRHGDGPPEV